MFFYMKLHGNKFVLKWNYIGDVNFRGAFPDIGSSFLSGSRPYIPSEHKQQGILNNVTTFLCQGIFSTFQKIKLVFLIVHLLFVTFKTNSGISHRWIIKSCIPAHNYNLNHLALSAAKCNPGSRKTVEHPLESCTSSFICFISMYVLKARILDLILKPPHPTLLYTTFDREGTLFVYLLLKNGAPFTYLVEKFISLLTDVNILYICTNRKTRRRFLDLFTAIKCAT